MEVATASSPFDVTSWLTAGVVLLLLGGCALASALARTSRLRIGFLVAFVVLLATFPVWTSIAFTWQGSLKSNDSGYWSVAPWYLMVAMLYMGYSGTAAVIVAAVYIFVRASHRAKLASAVAVASLAIAGMAWDVSTRQSQAQSTRDAITSEYRAAEDFARTHPEVLARVEPPVDASAHRSGARGDAPRYAVRVSRRGGRRHEWLTAVVFAHHDGDRTTFEWACIVPYADVRQTDDPCTETSPDPGT